MYMGLASGSCVKCVSWSRGRFDDRGVPRSSARLQQQAPDLRRDLASAIRKQADQQLSTLRKELIDPWLAPPPKPLTDTLPPTQLADPDSRFVEVDGVLLHYKQFGSDTSQPAILMLHGFNGSVFNWRYVMEDLSRQTGRRVIAFDRPPFGLSERPLQWEGGDDASPYSCRGGARATAGLLDALAVKSAVVVGHSMGAVVGMELLKLRPEKVAALCFVAPALPAWPDTFRRSMTFGAQLQSLARLALMRSDTAGLTWIRRMLRERAAEVADGKLQVHHDEMVTDPSIIEGYLRPMKADNWDRGSLLGFRVFSFPDDLPAYASIKQPVLVVQGRQDSTILTSTARQIAEQLEQRRGIQTMYVEIDGCGHIPPEEHPEKFVAAVVDFLQPQASGPSVDRRLQAAEERVIVADTTPVAAAGIIRDQSLR